MPLFLHYFAKVTVNYWKANNFALLIIYDFNEAGKCAIPNPKSLSVLEIL